jgi:hypothetical protein
MGVDFTDSGIAGLPPMTIETLSKGGDPRVLGWIREAVQEGDRINRSDPSYDQMEVGAQYVSGNQSIDPANAAIKSPTYIPGLQLNESRKAMQGHVSALTDIKPLFAYKSMNPAFALQADLVNKLTVAWWITRMVDITLGDVVKYAWAMGTGDMVDDWSPTASPTGDCVVSARDPRDTLPIRPATHSSSVQDWEGVVFREAHTVNVLRGLYPTLAGGFRPTTDSLLNTLMGRWKQYAMRFVSPAADTLSGLDIPAAASRVRSGECLLYKTYLTDRSRNLTQKDIPMGTPGATWSYVVKPGGYLYPYKRLIVATPDMLVYDGPSPYWHGQFPVSRLKLWSLPWQFLGIPALNDLRPVQDGINTTAQDLMLGIRKWMDPAVSYDRSAVSETFMRLFDPRRTGQKVKLTQMGVERGFKIHEGPAPQVLAIALQTLIYLQSQFADKSGTPNLQQLMELRQLPGAETIQRYWEALTPELRQEGRQVESFMRDTAERLKTLRFQFESNAKRVAILGDAGQLLQDFDFEPSAMVPAMQQGDPGYQPDLDASLPRHERAKAFHKTIIFTLAPNSILSMNATEGKMLRLQLARGGMYDFWSLCESLEIPNVGAPPAIMLPPLDPAKAKAEIEQMMLLPGGAAQLMGKYSIDPMTGAILEQRIPNTVTERLIAQQQLGLGMTESPAGRKASGQAPPQMEQKSDGRTTVTESKHEPGPNSDR